MTHSDDFDHVLNHALYGSTCPQCFADLDFISEKYLMHGSYRDRFYYLAQLNKHHVGLTRETLFKKVTILHEAYKDLFDPTLPFSTHNVHVCRYFFESATRIGDFRATLLRYCEDLDNPSIEDMQHLIDVLPHGNIRDTYVTELRIRQMGVAKDGGKYNLDDPLYHEGGDSAHVVSVVTKDGAELPDLSDRFEECVSKLEKDISSHLAIEAIRINNSVKNLRSTFVHVVDIINEHDKKDEMFKRLKEELNDMTDVCTTGMNARLVNVLTGYSDKIRIALEFEAELKATVYARFSSELLKTADSFRTMYYECIVSKEKKPEYILFKETTRAKLYDEIKREYETMPGYNEELFNSTYSKICSEI